MIAYIQSQHVPFRSTALVVLIIWAAAQAAGQICQPTPDQSGCIQTECPNAGEVCQPRCINFDPATGLYLVTDCECGLPSDCHLEFMRLPGPACLVPDDGSGTAEMPPFGCSYTNDMPWTIVDGLPPGTTMELESELGDFICDQPSVDCTLSVPAGVCEVPGGSLGGDGHCFDATMDFTLTGTGDLNGFNRVLSLPVHCEVHTSPRTPGDPVQSMDTVFYRLQGELFGDPDFDNLRVSAGESLSLPSPGRTTLRKLPSGDFAVDSFFDITYEIEFTGAPGSPLEGMSGTTTGAVRLYTGGSGAECIGDCPPGPPCEEQVTVLADGTLEICCGCTPENPDLKWSQPPSVELPGLHSHDFELTDGLEQIFVADDWLCQGGLVTDIHWWGNYEMHPMGYEMRGAGIDHFLLAIHQSDGEPQPNCLPGPMLWSMPVPFSATGETDTGLVNSDGSIIYRYSHVLDAPFEQEEGQSYFLVVHAVSAIPTDNPVWRWQEHQRAPVPILCGAAVDNVPPGGWQTIVWPGDPVEYSDMAFELTSQALLPPVADANGPYNAVEGTPIQFDGSGSYDLDGGVILYEWDFDSDGVYEVAFGTPTSTWTWFDNTNSSVTLRVTDNHGLTNTDTSPVRIDNVDPALAGVAATSVAENQYSVLTGSMSDPGILDTFTLDVDWGDGSPIVTYPYGAGTTAFTNFHQYLDDTPSDSYTITVTLQDDDLGVDSTTTMVTVSNVPPVLTNVTATSVVEGGISTVSGTIIEPSPLDSFTLRVTWGDGTATITNTYAAASVAFTETHMYLDDDPSGTPQDNYTIVVILEDDDSGIDTNRPQVTVSNAPPIIAGPSITPTGEGGTSTLTGSFTDPGLLDTFILTVDWGDTNVDTFPYPAGGGTTILQTHTYGPSDNYVVGINLADDDRDASQGFLSVTVSNVPPTADANGPYSARVGEDIQLDGTGSSDPGNDIVLYEWDLDNDSLFNDAVGPNPLFKLWWVGSRTIGLKVTDDDGAFDFDTALVIGEPPLPCPKWMQQVDCEFGLDVESWYTDPEPIGPAPTVADDWLCDGRPLVGIQWWGSYIGYLGDVPDPFLPPPGGPDRPTGFRVRWYTDIPATPTSHSRPGDLIEERPLPLADFGLTNPIPGVVIEEPACLVDLGWFTPGLVEHVYRYTYWFNPGEEFNEKAGAVYWLSVEARYDSALPPPAWRWGWTTTSPQWNWNDDAVLQVDPPLWGEMVYPPPGWEHIPGHPYAGVSVNQAFALLTDVCPSRCIKWEQPPDMITGVNMLSSRIDGLPGPVRADDFFSDGRAITDIHWWGSYIGWQSDLSSYQFPPGGIERPIAFDLRWHADNAGTPGPELRNVRVDIDRCHEVYYGTVDQTPWNPAEPFEHEFQYYVDLLDPRIRESEPWPEMGGVPYWLSIQAVFDTNWTPGAVHAGWGWKTTEIMRPHPSVFSLDGFVWAPDPTGHPATGALFFDLSFELTTTKIPPHDIRLLNLDPAAFVSLVSSGYCGCGVQVLEHAGPAFTNGWSAIQTNTLPRRTNTWVVPQLSLTNRHFRIDARQP